MDLPRLQEPVRVDSEAMISSVLKDGVLELRPSRPEQRNALDEPMVDGLRASRKVAQGLLVDSDDHAEGVRAARDDRPPSFTGR
jgi:enoyl-CoA hydratase/carnithine racemase